MTIHFIIPNFTIDQPLFWSLLRVVFYGFLKGYFRDTPENSNQTQKYYSPQ